MKGPEAKALYGHVLDELAKGLPGGKEKVKGEYLTVFHLLKVIDGVFGAMMQVDISNDVRPTLCPSDMQGPVTIILDTKKE